MATKKTFITQTQGAADRLAQAAQDILTLRDVYFDRGYNVGGATPIIDSDVPPEAGTLTATQIGDFINFANQLDALLNNGVVTQGDWSSTVNRIRGDV